MASKYIIQVSRDNFALEVKQSQALVLVDFWAEWCGPCKAMSPLLDELAEAHVNKLKIVKVNVDENQDLAAEYGIRAIPTLFLFKNGEIKEQLVGLLSGRDLKSKLAPYLS